MSQTQIVPSYRKINVPYTGEELEQMQQAKLAEYQFQRYEHLSLELEKEILKEFPLPISPKNSSLDSTEGYIINNNHIVQLEIHGYSNFRRLPASIGGLRHLEILDLSTNGLESLPNELGNLTDLRELRLAKNNLVTLPAVLRALPNLKRLDVENNPLSPESIELLVKLLKQGCSIQALNLPQQGLFIDI
jgi:Leucine-rich repeat (LRR) protein